MIYGFVLEDQTIHIKSDVIPQDEDKDEDSEGSVYDDEEEEEVDYPADISDVLNSNRGPLYHSLCDTELLHPRDSRLYRIRSLSAHGSRTSRTQPDITVQDFKLAKYKEESDLNLSCELIGSDDEGEDTPPRQVNLAFLRVCKLVKEEAIRVLYSTKTFAFSDAATFAKFFSIDCTHVENTKGRNLLFTDRNAIHSVQLRAETGLCLHQKLLWTHVLNAAPFVLPGLNKIRVTFDLCYNGNESFVDGSLWQSGRHRQRFPLLKRAEVRVATHFAMFVKGDGGAGEVEYEYRDVGWGRLIGEDDVRHHMDALFGTLPGREDDDSDDGGKNGEVGKGGETVEGGEKREIAAEGEVGEEEQEHGQDKNEEDDVEEVEEAEEGELADDGEEEAEAEQ